MQMDDREALGRFVKEHHVHYEIEPEAVGDGERREVVGYEVRLFASHGGSKLPAPGCPQCVDLLGELKGFAEQLVAPGHAASWTRIAPEAAALYESAEDRGADEVSLAMHVLCDSPDHRRAEAGGRRCLDEVRERLGAAGIPKR